MTFSYPKLKLVFPTLIVMRPPSITSLSVSPVLGWGWASPIFVHGQILEKASLLLVNFVSCVLWSLSNKIPFLQNPSTHPGIALPSPPPHRLPSLPTAASSAIHAAATIGLFTLECPCQGKVSTTALTLLLGAPPPRVPPPPTNLYGKGINIDYDHGKLATTTLLLPLS